MDKSCSFYQVVGGSNPTRPTLYDTLTPNLQLHWLALSA